MRVVTAPSFRLLKREKFVIKLPGLALKSLKLQVNLNLRKKLDLRKIVATTNFLVHKFFDLRKIF